jgi:hypothetical protein
MFSFEKIDYLFFSSAFEFMQHLSYCHLSIFLLHFAGLDTSGEEKTKMRRVWIRRSWNGQKKQPE